MYANDLYRWWNHVYWLKSNKLVVNPSKSNSVLIGTRQRSIKSTLTISINDCTVKFTNTFNLLGVITDNNLSWKDHIIIVAVYQLQL